MDEIFDPSWGDDGSWPEEDAYPHVTGDPLTYEDRGPVEQDVDSLVARFVSDVCMPGAKNWPY